MPAESPIDWKTIRAAIHEWFTEQTGLDTHWAHQPEQTQLPLPYGWLKVLSGPRLVHSTSMVSVFAEDNPNGEQKERHFNNHAEFTVSCSVECDSTKGGRDAVEYLGRAQMALQFPSVLKALRAAGAAVVNIGDIIDLTEVRGGVWQSRAAMDVVFRTRAHVLGEKTTFIETVNAKLRLKGGVVDPREYDINLSAEAPP